MSDTEKIKVIIADDHDVYRDGLKMLLDRNKDIELIGEAANGNKLIELVKILEPDVVLTDLMMPQVDGIEAIKQISKLGLGIKTIAISTFDSDYLIVEALEAGALGYINKNAQKGEIIEAIQTVYENHPYYCKTTSSLLIQRISKSKFDPFIKSNLNKFEEREKQIIKLICQEKTSEEIAKTLFLGVRTVESLRAKILKRINAKSATGIVVYAIRNGLYFVE